MMPPLFALFDTALKIGLGAAITAFSSQKLQETRYEQGLDKDRRDRKYKLLEEVAEGTTAFTHRALGYWARISDYAEIVGAGEEPADSYRKDVLDAHNELFKGFSRLSAAEAKLMLLRESAARDLLREYGELVQRFRLEADIGNPDLPQVDLDQYRQEILDRREQAYQALGEIYERLD